jgi:hypothetical protein
MEWRELVGRTIVSARAARAGQPDETIPDVLHLRFTDGSAAIISCDWASHERPWLSLEEAVPGDEPPDLALELDEELP